MQNKQFRRVAVFGMGYVGCVTAACLSRDGHQVVGIDIDSQKTAMLASGRSPVAEPGLDQLIAQQVAAGRLTIANAVDEAIERSEIALITVGTPSAEDGSVETGPVERVIEMIAKSLQGTTRSYTVVVRSTLLPGILEDRLMPMLEGISGRRTGDTLSLVNNPEFLRETTAIADYDSPPFVLVGAAERDQARPAIDLYHSVDAEQIVVDTRTAALVKYACNAFHALKVGFANEIGALSRLLGADGQEVMSVLCRDRRLNISPAYLRPGFAFGGSCLPKDVRALARYAQQHALKTELLSAVMPSNDAHIERALQEIRRRNVRKIGLVGLSFKAGTDDLRESPLVILAESLLGRGYDLRIFDPAVQVSRLVGTNLAYVDRHLPHLAALLVDNAEILYHHAELAILGSGVADDSPPPADFQGMVFDLRRDLVTPIRDHAEHR